MIFTILICAFVLTSVVISIVNIRFMFKDRKRREIEYDKLQKEREIEREIKQEINKIKLIKRKEFIEMKHVLYRLADYKEKFTIKGNVLSLEVNNLMPLDIDAEKITEGYRQRKKAEGASLHQNVSKEKETHKKYAPAKAEYIYN